LICQHGDHAVSLLNEKKELHILANSFQDSALNSPNDIVVRSDSTVYFTDPPYGLKDQVLEPLHFQPLAGLYLYKEGELTLAATGLKYPNGLAFSPGEEYLYVSSTHPEDKKLLKYRSLPDGSLVLIETVIEECADGITTDKSGSLFLSTEKGILIVSPGGEKLALLPLPEWPSNMAWVDNDDGILLVTARSSIYRINFR
jgi:gluconolactonase